MPTAYAGSTPSASPAMAKGSATPTLDRDPRLPSAVSRWKRPLPQPDELPPDYYALVSLALGMFGLFLRVRVRGARARARCVVCTRIPMLFVAGVW